MKLPNSVLREIVNHDVDYLSLYIKLMIEPRQLTDRQTDKLNRFGDSRYSLKKFFFFFLIDVALGVAVLRGCVLLLPVPTSELSFGQ